MHYHYRSWIHTPTRLPCHMSHEYSTVVYKNFWRHDDNDLNSVLSLISGSFRSGQWFHPLKLLRNNWRSYWQKIFVLSYGYWTSGLNKRLKRGYYQWARGWPCAGWPRARTWINEAALHLPYADAGPLEWGASRFYLTQIYRNSANTAHLFLAEEQRSIAGKRCVT